MTALTAIHTALLEDAERGMPGDVMTEKYGVRQMRAALLHHQWVRSGAGDIITLTEFGKLELALWRALKDARHIT